MPVNATLNPSKLKITYSAGMNGEGKEVLKSKTYSNIKATATDEDVYAVADVLIALQKNEALRIGRLDDKELVQA